VVGMVWRYKIRSRDRGGGAGGVGGWAGGAVFSPVSEPHPFCNCAPHPPPPPLFFYSATAFQNVYRAPRGLLFYILFRFTLVWCAS
jgi:hypothetical protein